MGRMARAHLTQVPLREARAGLSLLRPEAPL
eukprot:COSAG01_NODE_38739_length_485_cov_20.595855_2_plen_30_part_01